MGKWTCLFDDSTELGGMNSSHGLDKRNRKLLKVICLTWLKGTSSYCFGVTLQAIGPSYPSINDTMHRLLR